MTGDYVLAVRANASEKRGSYYVYGHDPSQPLAIAAAVLFGAMLLTHSYQVYRYRAWYFSAMVVAGIMETLGYITRILSAQSVLNRGLFICQFAMVVLAPVMIAAGDYIIFGRLMESLLPGGRHARALRIPARWVTVIFITGDMLSFVLQGVGSGVMTGASDGRHPQKMRMGQNIMIGGLGVQVLFFGFFTIATIRFDVKTRGMGTQQGQRWRWLLWVLYASCVLILMRSIFRVVEFAEGWTGYLASHEVYFYTLEALPMLIAVFLFNVIHPGKFLPQPEKETDRSELKMGMAEERKVSSA